MEVRRRDGRDREIKLSVTEQTERCDSSKVIKLWSLTAIIKMILKSDFPNGVIFLIILLVGGVIFFILNVHEPFAFMFILLSILLSDRIIFELSYISYDYDGLLAFKKALKERGVKDLGKLNLVGRARKDWKTFTNRIKSLLEYARW